MFYIHSCGTTRILWEYIPLAVKVVMLQRQVDQGNENNEEVFKVSTDSSRGNGGFNWDVTPEGYGVWAAAIRSGDFDYFDNLPEPEILDTEIVNW